MNLFKAARRLAFTLSFWVALSSTALPQSSSLSSQKALPRPCDLKGKVVDTQGNALPGAVCTLNAARAGLLPAPGLSVTAGEKGGFEFPGLLPGTYDLTCAAVGYLPVEQKGVEVTDEGAPFVQATLPLEVVVKKEVVVTGKASSVAAQPTALPARLQEVELKALPLAQQKFRAALPLIPGVVRTPDGRISIKGSVETQGMLLVDSAQTVDPVSGSFAIDVPLDAVESIEVRKTAYQAEFGRFSGGLTSIETKPPSGQRHFELNDFLPDLRVRSGHLVGLAGDKPRLSLTAPLWDNRLYFSEAFTYDLEKQPVRGLAWPHNETKSEGFTSFTSFQYIISPRNLLTANANVFPLRREFADISSLVPQSASSNYGQRGYAASVTDRYFFNSGAVLTTLFQFIQFNSYAHGQGSLDMLVTPNGLGGNYFNSWNRTSAQQELLQSFQIPTKDWLGKHEVKIGADFVHRAYDGTSLSRPIRLLRANGSLAEKIDFSGPASLSARDTEAAAYFQDHWIFSDHLAVDAGLRYSGQTIGEKTAFAPRGGVVYSPGTGGKTIFRAGIGLFYDHLPLLAGDFPNNPRRILNFFNAHGQPLGAPIVLQNAYERVNDQNQTIIPSPRHLDSTPHNLTWNFEIDREIRPNVLARVSFLSSRTYDVFVIDPRLLRPGGPTLLLTNTGGSRYEEFESTLRVRRGERADFNFSYLRSAARGDLNALGQVYVPFEAPVIHANRFGVLPSNTPNRVVAWGRFKLPWESTASPLLDIHTGFPYSNYNVFYNYVGVPNSQRFPTFLSLDWKMTKDATWRALPWVKKHTFRLGVTIFNLTNRSNPRDVYSSVLSPFFGHFVGFQQRTYELSLDIVY